MHTEMKVKRNNRDNAFYFLEIRIISWHPLSPIREDPPSDDVLGNSVIRHKYPSYLNIGVQL